MTNPPVPTPPASAAPRALARKAPHATPTTARELTLREVGRSLVEGRWVILGALAIAAALAVAYLFVARPTYRATALVQIEDPPPAAAGLERLAPAFEVKSSAAGEIEIMRSRMVLAPIVDRLGLDRRAEPRHFPLVGAALARRHRGGGFAPPPIAALGRFAWGGEKIDLDRLEVPRSLIDAPLTLTAQEGSTFRVADEHGATVVEGRVGELAVAEAAGERAEILVARLDARPGTEFRLEKKSRDEVIDELQASLKVEERGKSSSVVSSGVVSVQLDGRDPAIVASIVSELASIYVRQNVERRSAEAAKSLEFIESQLPGVEANLESAEAALTKFRVANGTVDLGLETTAMVDRASRLDRDVSELTSELTQLRQRYADKHPDIAPLERKLEATRAARAALDRRLRTLPGAQLTAARLLRQVTVATELYTLLLDRAQALRVVKSGTIGNVRIVDRPFVAHRPVSPRPAPVLVIGLLLGLGVGVAAALGRRALREAPEDSQDVEHATGLPVFVTIPHSSREGALHRRTGSGAREPLAQAAPDDVATEQLRTLRTVLGFVLKERGNVVSFSSPSAGVGKTFVCTNLAHLLAAAGKRVLLVDADLRRGALHRHFAVSCEPGMTDVVAGSSQLEAGIRQTGITGLDLLPVGSPAQHPAELLASPHLQEILSAASQRYDVVIVDTPPSLAVTDPLLVARCASVNLLVLRAREHSPRQIALALERFGRSGVEVQGAVLNDARVSTGRYPHVYEHRSTSSRA